VTKRENNRRFFTKKEGVKPDARKDFKNNRAIINEKRVKKVGSSLFPSLLLLLSLLPSNSFSLPIPSFTISDISLTKHAIDRQIPGLPATSSI
jgi:hypothetical protein